MHPVKKKKKKCITNTQNKTYIQEKKTPTQTKDENRTETHKN